jgi:hypothetical protein
MAADDVYRKTALGVAEIKDRALKLSPRLRTMLILVDGLQSEAQLMEEAAGVGAPGDFLAQLARAGLIERVSTSQAPPMPPAAKAAPGNGVTKFREAKSFMSRTIAEALGSNSIMFTTKLDRANGVAELSALIDAFRTALAGAKGEDYARSMTARLKEIIR